MLLPVATSGAAGATIQLLSNTTEVGVLYCLVSRAHRGLPLHIDARGTSRDRLSQSSVGDSVFHHPIYCHPGYGDLYAFYGQAHFILLRQK